MSKLTIEKLSSQHTVEDFNCGEGELAHFLKVHAKDDSVKAWYQKFDFAPSPTDPLHLYLLIKDIKKIIQGS